MPGCQNISNWCLATTVVTQESRIWVSHGTKEISGQLLSRMAEQLNLSRQQFLDLIDCRLDEAGLIAVYKEMHLL